MANNIIILGAGESGVGAAILAQHLGHSVLVSDGGKIADKYKLELSDFEIAWEEHGHSLDRILKADLIVKSPGIPEKAAIMQQVREANIPVISEIEWAYRHAEHCKIVAITGTNGKSTTTALIHHICITAGLDAALVGNIGVSFARQVALAPKPYYIVEVSSFQLDDIVHFKPDVAILLNITEDHLDRYNYQMEKYVHSKFQIIKNLDPSNYFIYSADDPVTTTYLPQYFNNQTNPFPFSMKKQVTQGAFIKDQEMLIKMREEDVKMSIHDFALKGKHNQNNTMAAGIAATALDIRKEKIREAVQTFESLDHRLQPVLTIKGVEYINDSKATNINGTWFALESIATPVVLILGGVDKGNDYSLIADLVAEKAKAIICLGTDNSKLLDFFTGKVPQIHETNNMEAAVLAAYNIAQKGDTVLLSPACASFDLFLNYEDRGHQFAKAVKNL
ncbi:MAG: UDP-N-acetylmuramoyl-L-alanine--D-glutamate ligase [Bacteroidetes bacterium]|nr:MAG: UDP-N-acetylmuramoyl-L-alanine--D-glutamate ligase [Bacteroidota bacterium]